MNVGSIGFSSQLFEVKEHKAGCQCPACCKNNSAQVGVNSDLIRVGSESITSSSSKEDESSVLTLSASQQQQLAGLKARDTEVRTHEAAHIAAGGSAVTGGASYTYQKGPDGQLYAIGGEVPVSLGGGSTPEEKIANAQAARAGALAPANPSPADLKVAASAALIESQARAELSEQKSAETKERAATAYGQNDPQKSSNAIPLLDISA